MYKKHSENKIFQQKKLIYREMKQYLVIITFETSNNMLRFPFNRKNIKLKNTNLGKKETETGRTHECNRL